MEKIYAEKIAIFSDVHFGRGKDAERLLEKNKEALDWIKDECLKRNINTIFFLGDWFHSRSQINVNTLNYGYDVLSNLSNDLNFHLIIGNHDIYHHSISDVNSLKTFKDLKNVKIYEKEEEIEIDSRKNSKLSCLICPWNWNFEKYKDFKYDVMFGHLNMSGVRVTNVSSQHKGDYTLSELSKMSNLIFSGHFHFRKDDYVLNNSKIVCVGNPLQMNWGDYLNSKGFYILDVISKDFEFVKNTVSPEYVKVFISELGKQKNNIKIKDNIVRLMVDQKTPYDKVMKINNLIETKHPFWLDQPEFTYTIGQNQLEGIEFNFDKDRSSITPKDYICKFIEEASFEDFEEFDRSVLTQKAISIHDECDNSFQNVNNTTITFQEMNTQNFQSIGQNMTFDFESHYGLNYILGENADIPGVNNGSGKSTIFVDSPIFSIFGKNFANTSNRYIPHRIFNDDKSNPITNCDIKFKIGEDQYYVRNYISTKNKKSKTVSIYLEKNGQDISKSTAMETRKFIEREILYTSYDLFKSSIILNSSGIFNIFQMNKENKRNYIEGIFGLTVFSEMLKSVRSKINSLDKEGTFIQKELQVIHDDINKLTIGLNEFDENKNKRIQIIETQIEDKKKQIEFLQSEIVDIKDLEKKQLAISKIGLLEEKIQSLSNESRLIEKNIHSHNNEIKIANQTLETYLNIFEAVCDDCKSHVDRLVNINDNKERIEKRKDEILKFQKQIQILNEKGNTFDQKIQVLRKIEQQIKELLNQKASNERLIQHLKEEIEHDFDLIKTERETTSPFQTLIEEKNSELEAKKEVLKNITENLKYMEILETVVNEDGAKQKMLIDLVEMINSLCTKYLEQMGSEFIPRFEPNFNVAFLTKTGPCEYSSFSRGEQQRINLSTVLAFQDIQRINIKTNFVVFDEIMDSGIDEYAFKAFVDILKHKSEKENLTIFFISHKGVIDEDMFDNIIKVEKKNGYSRIISDYQQKEK